MDSLVILSSSYSSKEKQQLRALVSKQIDIIYLDGELYKQKYDKPAIHKKIGKIYVPVIIRFWFPMILYTSLEFRVSGNIESMILINGHWECCFLCTYCLQLEYREYYEYTFVLLSIPENRYYTVSEVANRVFEITNQFVYIK